MSHLEELQAAEARAAKAEARASEAESNMMTAANYGKQLLEQLQESEKSRAELEQEKYSLKLNLQNLEASEKTFQDEIQGIFVEIDGVTIWLFDNFVEYGRFIAFLVLLTILSILDFSNLVGFKTPFHRKVTNL